MAMLLAVLVATLAFAGTAAAQDSTPAAQASTVGDTEVTWEGDWEIDPNSSDDDQISLVQIDEAAQQLTLANYAQIADPSVEDRETAMDTFAESFFEGAGVQPVEPTDGGELEDGTLWRLYDFDLQSFGLSMILTMDQLDDGTFVVSAVVANTDGFSEAVATAQEQISLDGETVFLDGIGAEQLGSGAATPAASTPVS